MSHGITATDSMFSVSSQRQPPWHGLGVVLDDYPQSIDEALDKAGLGWKVTHGDVLVVNAPEWTDDFGIKHPPELIPAKGFYGQPPRGHRRGTRDRLRRVRGGRQPRRVPISRRADRLRALLRAYGAAGASGA